MINLTIDGQPISVPKGTTVYEAAKKLKVDIPIFCYQDRMPPFGACRVCMVEVEKMGKPQTSCTLEATEGMVVKTQSTLATESRKEILEFLLANHPLDCPICDRAGECPLQDNTMKFGPGKSHFYEEKRHASKALPLGPVLMLDRERCIQCARCTRFHDQIAGDNALEFIDRGYKMEVGTPNDRPAESKFIGNSIMLCPVGALTSEVYRFRARPWDNKVTSSSCTLCPVGCSLYLDQRDGEIMRTRARESREVNDIWLCDKGWFGYEFTAAPDRLTAPLIKRNDRFEEATWEEALSLIANKIKTAKTMAALGGNPLTVEENFLFQKFVRECMGVNNIDHRVGMPILSAEEEGLLPGMEISLDDCEKLSTIILCGVDLTEEFPVIWLRLRQAINRGAKALFLGHFAPEISTYLTQTVLHAPGKEVSALQDHLPVTGEGKSAIFVGRQYLANPNRRAILSELLNRKGGASINILEGNNAAFAGVRPDRGPYNSVRPKTGLNAQEIIQAGEWDFLYVVGSNPVMKYPSHVWNAMQLKFLVVQDLFLTETALQADVVLPALSFIEKEGSFLNVGGYVQKIRPGKAIPENVYSDGEIFRRLAEKMHRTLQVDEKLLALLHEGHIPTHYPAQLEAKAVEPVEASFLATFSTVLFDQGVRMKHNPHLIQLAKEPKVKISIKDGLRHGFKTGDRVIVKVNEAFIATKIQLDETVAEKTIVLPVGFDALPVQELTLNYLNGTPVTLHRDEAV